MRGLRKLSGAANTMQARRDYAWLLNLAAEHGIADLIPIVGRRPGWRAFDNAAKISVARILNDRPDLREAVMAIYPGLF